MHPNRPGKSVIVVCAMALLLTACEDGTVAPTPRVEPVVADLSDDAGNLGPVDLVYVCGNKFLATNSTRSTVHVTYRVAGTRETGGVTLPPGPIEDPGHSETELETRQAGAVELFRDGQRVVRRRNQKLTCGTVSFASASAVAAGPAESGSWGPVFPWPVVAIHASLLRDGRVLSWGLSGTPFIWDPTSGAFTSAPSGAELFCSGHSFLPDGRVLVAGGHIASDRGIADISIFSPATGAWSASAPMRRGRWYPTNTTLANGSVVILAGRDEVGDEVAEPEIWSPDGIRQLSGASLVLPYYPRTFLAPNGQIFYAGEQPTTRYLNTSGSGSWTTVGGRRYGGRSYGAAVMYDDGKILYVGGGRTTNTAEIINLNLAAPTWQWTGSMAFPRRNLNATVLPNGEVLVTGGSTGTAYNDWQGGVLAAEMWSPTTGAWRTMASNAVKRTYHSTSLLLPDGRVLHAGSGEGDGMPEERSAELYSPPYLARGPRPTISDLPAAVAYGTTFLVATPQAAAITKVSLIRLGSVTHAFNMEQRFQWLPFVREGTSLRVTAPASGNRAPPGHYMVFILDGNGVPSVGRIVKVSASSEPSPTNNTAPDASFIAGCSGLTCNFADRSSDADGNLSGWTWSFGDGDASSIRDPNHAFGAAGTYTVTLTATDREGATDVSSKQVTVPGQQFPITLTLTTRTATGKQHVDLAWSRGQGPMMYVYRNGLVQSSTGNDGRHTVTRTFTGAATYIFKICEAGTTICSNTATATFNGGAPVPNTPPNAIFTPNCNGDTCRFADGSSDPDGNVTAWQWSFGDGSSASVRNPAHTYAAGGSYSVRLTVSDNSGSTGSTTRQVSVIATPNAPPTASFSETCDNRSCEFLDLSTDPDGSIVSWHWDFGDGSSSTLQSPPHTYTEPGQHDVTLTVTDNRGAQASETRVVPASPYGPNETPTAGFASNCTGLACAFTDASTDEDGRITAWQWDFGDGSTAAVRHPSHTYADDGAYTVSLTVTDDADGQGSASEQVSVTNTLPVADFGSSCSGLTCTFSDRSRDGDGGIVAWSWSFGDGASSTTRNPSRTYAAPGTYTVRLTVTDNAGGAGEQSAPVTVTAASPISLTATGREDATKQYMTYIWTGAAGARVDMHRNGTKVADTPNDGRQILSRNFTAPATYVLKICETGGTRCSNEVTLVFN